MDIEHLNQIASIAQSVMVITVLMAWLFREIKARDSLTNEILDDYRDMKSIRLRRASSEQDKLELPQ